MYVMHTALLIDMVTRSHTWSSQPQLHEQASAAPAGTFPMVAASLAALRHTCEPSEFPFMPCQWQEWIVQAGLGSAA